jgi:hypothetical protein
MWTDAGIQDVDDGTGQTMKAHVLEYRATCVSCGKELTGHVSVDVEMLKLDPTMLERQRQPAEARLGREMKRHAAGCGVDV